MAVNIGSRPLKAAYVGSTPLKAIYVGSTLVSRKIITLSWGASSKVWMIKSEGMPDERRVFFVNDANMVCDKEVEEYSGTGRYSPGTIIPAGTRVVGINSGQYEFTEV